jgi:hypothetical protein
VFLSIFRTNQLFTAIFLLIYIALLHLAPIWIDDNWEPAAYGVGANWFYNQFGFKGNLTQVIAGLLLFIQAFILVNIDFQHKLSKEPTLFAGVFLILISSISVPFLHLSPYYFANVFLLLALHAVLSVYRKSDATGAIFNAGFFVALASLFVPTYLIFLFLIFAALNLLRGFSFKERIMVLLGVIAVYFSTFAIFFWNNDLATLQQLQVQDAFGLFDIRSGNSFTLIHLGLLSILLLLTVFFRGQIIGKKVMQVQRKIDIFYWGMLITLLVVVFQAEIQENTFLVVAPFLGLFLGIQFGSMKSNVAELLHLLLFIFVLLLQFRPFFLP